MDEHFDKLFTKEYIFTVIDQLFQFGLIYETEKHTYKPSTERPTFAA